MYPAFHSPSVLKPIGNRYATVEFDEPVDGFRCRRCRSAGVEVAQELAAQLLQGPRRRSTTRIGHELYEQRIFSATARPAAWQSWW